MRRPTPASGSDRALTWPWHGFRAGCVHGWRAYVRSLKQPYLGGIVGTGERRICIDKVVNEAH